MFVVDSLIKLISEKEWKLIIQRSVVKTNGFLNRVITMKKKKNEIVQLVITLFYFQLQLRNENKTLKRCN